MRQAALYYPFIVPRNQAWWRVAALYWPSVIRLVPKGVDPRTPHGLDNANWIHTMDPAPYIERVSENFRDSLEQKPDDFGPAFSTLDALTCTSLMAGNGGPYFPPLGPEALLSEQTDPSWGNRISVILREELHTSLQTYLLDQRLAFDHPTASHLIIVRNAMARAYKCALSEEVARCNNLVPITDTLQSFLTMGTWTGNPDTQQATTSHRTSYSDPHQFVGMLALNLAVPADIDRISAQSIVALRNEFAADFDAFTQLVHDTANELRQQLADVEDPELAQIYVQQEVSGRFEAPYRQLQRDINSLRMDAATSIASMKVDLPAISAAAAAHLVGQNPAITAAAGATFGFIAVRHGLRQKARALTPPSPASYLLKLNRLASQGRWGKTKRLSRRILYGDRY